MTSRRTSANFADQMVYCTNSIGAGCGGTSKQRTATYNLGPYLERVPENPFNSLATLGAARPGRLTRRLGVRSNTGEIRAR